MESISVVAEFLADLGLSVFKEKYKNRIREKKLQETLLDYVVRQRKYEEICTLEEEVDFEGIIVISVTD